MSEPRTEDWVSHGLAAMDELRRLYFEGSADRGPGDITVKDWEPCEDAIRSAFAAALAAAPAGLDVERLARAFRRSALSVAFDSDAIDQVAADLAAAYAEEEQE